MNTTRNLLPILALILIGALSIAAPLTDRITGQPWETASYAVAAFAFIAAAARTRRTMQHTRNHPDH